MQVINHFRLVFNQAYTRLSWRLHHFYENGMKSYFDFFDLWRQQIWNHVVLAEKQTAESSPDPKTRALIVSR